MSQVEGENASYKTRRDDLQEHVTTLDKDLKESREGMRSTAAAHAILIDRIMQRSGFCFSAVPTEEEVEKRLRANPAAMVKILHNTSPLKFLALFLGRRS